MQKVNHACVAGIATEAHQTLALVVDDALVVDQANVLHICSLVIAVVHSFAEALTFSNIASSSGMLCG